MKLLTQVLVGTFSLVGGCCTIGVPVALNLSQKTARRNIELVKCEAVSGEVQRSEVSFGDANYHSVCYSLSSSEGEKDSEEEESDSAERSTELVDLLKGEWQSWTDGRSLREYPNWKTRCGTGTSGWQLNSLANNKRVLGNCKVELGQNDSERDTTTIFLEIENEESKERNPQLKVCLKGQECWSDDFNDQDVRKFKTPVDNFWKSINFYENSVGQLSK